jgi:hypothetical protein
MNAEVAATLDHIIGRASQRAAVGEDYDQAQVQEFITAAANRAAPRIIDLAQRLGVSGQSTWSGAVRDMIAANLLNDLHQASGRPPTATDARVAREAVKMVGRSQGKTVADDDGSVMGEDVMGVSWLELANPFWLAGQSLKLGAKGVVAAGKGIWAGTKWLGRQIGIGSKGSSSPSGPADVTQSQAYKDAIKRRQAAAARIRAAEQRQEAAILKRNQAEALAAQQAKATDSEAAAQEAESIATDAEAMQSVPYDSSADMGAADAIVGEIIRAGQW